MDVIYDTLRKQKRNNYTKKKNKFKTLKCHPKHFTSKNHTLRNSCLEPKLLNTMKHIWNKRYPDNTIRTNKTKEIWKKLRQNMASSCSNEMCWIDKTFQNNNKLKNIKKKLFAPVTPHSWKKNINEWLSSVELIDVMKQYEETFPEFKFFGPSPIDFDTIEYKNSCVWPEICNINIKDLYHKKKNKLGFIFNTDKHYQGGSHWIAMFVDLDKKKSFFFDSNGTKEPREISKLMKKIKRQCDKNDLGPMDLDSNYRMEHQKTNTECGMYCLYFIISLLKNTHNMDYFKNKRIPDKHVENFRKIYFNHI